MWTVLVMSAFAAKLHPKDQWDAHALDGLTSTIDGRAQALLDLPGPLVIDVWASWCGPCKQSLPHLDALATRYAGVATVVALSIDQDPAAANRLLKAGGDHAFLVAFADPQFVAGLTGVALPVTYVWSADRRWVDQIWGYGEGDERVDKALGKALDR